MSDNLDPDAARPIRFLLVRRPLKDGQVAIVLRLYGDGKPSTETTIATVRPSVARLTLLASRLHLLNRGSECCPPMPRAARLEVLAEAA